VLKSHGGRALVKMSIDWKMKWEVSASGQLETFLEPNDNQYPNVCFVHEK